MSHETPPTRRSAEQQQSVARLAKLFDLRTFIGALFLIFGVVVTVEGLLADPAAIAKAAGIRLSLWTGLVMLAVGASFITWLLLSPPDVEVDSDDLTKAPDHH